MLIGVTILATLVCAAAAGWAMGRDALPLPRPAVLARVCLPLAVFSIYLIAANGLAIREAMDRRAWPTTTGLVVGSRIVTIGRKNYQPEITYEYSVDNQTYSIVTHLDTPGFGMSSSREDAADAIVANHPLGEEVKVWLNPTDPADSSMRPGPSWAPLTRFAFGTMLLALAVALQTARTYGRKPEA